MVRGPVQDQAALPEKELQIALGVGMTRSFIHLLLEDCDEKKEADTKKSTVVVVVAAERKIEEPKEGRVTWGLRGSRVSNCSWKKTMKQAEFAAVRNGVPMWSIGLSCCLPGRRG